MGSAGSGAPVHTVLLAPLLRTVNDEIVAACAR